MSEYFNIRCDQCDAEESVDTNHGDKHARLAIDHREALLALYRAGFTYIGDWAWRVPLDFFEDHEGHPLRVISEYEPR